MLFRPPLGLRDAPWQVCRPVFTRVDSLFGMGSAINAAQPPKKALAVLGAGGPAEGSSAHGGAVVIPPPLFVEAEKPKSGLAGFNPLGSMAKKVTSKLSSAEMKGIVQVGASLSHGTEL